MRGSVWLPAGVISLLILTGTAAAAEAGLLGETSSFLEMLQHGRNINIVLGLLGLLTIFISFHSLLVTRRKLTVPPVLLREILDDLASGDVERAQKRAMGDDSLLAGVVLPGLRLHSHPPERIHQAMEGAGRRALGGIRQKIAYLANIGVLCPMIGLLGTVLGLMSAFVVLGAEEQTGAKAILMSAAIGKAITTTAVGLLVGIPAMALHYLLNSRAARVGDELEIAAEEVAAALGELKK